MQLLAFIKNIIAYAICLFLSACSLNTSISLGQGAHDIEGDKNPIVLSLSQGYVADNVLHLRVQLEFLDKVVADSIYVQLRSLKKGVVQEEQTLPVSNFVDTSLLEPGTIIYLPFTLAIGDIDRFTISCSWGEAGYKLATELDLIEIADNSTISELKDQTIPVKIAEIKILEMEQPCESNLCSVRVNLEGRVVRANIAIGVKSVALAYKLVWVPDGEIPSVLPSVEADKKTELAPDEKILPFGEEILPKEGFEFKVLGDKDLPKIPGGRFMPVVRILRYETIVEAP